MRRAVLLLAALLTACEPTPGEQAIAELGPQMRAQTDLVRRGEHLDAIFTGCSSDCEGHRAGYLWAVDNPEVTSAEWCDNRSASFEAGCIEGLRAAAFE